MKPNNLLSKFAQLVRPFIPEGVFANLGQWYSRYLHEPDFEIFDWLIDTPGLVLDVGANRGHSALDVLRHTRHMHVFSAEPNSEHRLSLLLIRLLHPVRFRFSLVAAGDALSRKTLLIPGNRNDSLSAYASLNPVEFEKDHIRDFLAKSGIDSHDISSFRQVSTRVVPLDCLSLSPDFIKLDVEGFELQALQGLKVTLQYLQPALLIEMTHPEHWMLFVKSFGYDFYYYDAPNGVLKSYQDTGDVINLLCLHPNSQSKVTQVLLGKAKLLATV